MIEMRPGAELMDAFLADLLEGPSAWSEATTTWVASGSW